MKIDSTLERPDGTLQFTGELTGQELTTVVSYGLNTLFVLGLIPTENITEETFEGPSQDETVQ